MKKYDNTSAINALKRTQKKYQIDFERFEVAEQTARNNKELIAKEIARLDKQIQQLEGETVPAKNDWEAQIDEAY